MPRTADLATYASQTTVWTRTEWLHALALIPARHELDEGNVDVVGKLAMTLRSTPSQAVVSMWTDRG